MNRQETNPWPEPDAGLLELPVPYTEVDSNGVLRVVNQAASRLLDMPVEQLIGHEIWEMLPPDEAARSHADFVHAMETGQTPVIRRSLYNFHGGYRSHEIHRRIMRDAQGHPIGVRCILLDTSELESAHRAAGREKLWLESVIDAIPQAVMVTDSLGFVRFANPSAQRLTGRSAQELTGQQIEKGMPILRAVSRNERPLSFRIALDEPWNGDVDLLHRDGQTLSIWLSASPILDKKTGYTNGVVIVMKPAVPAQGSPPTTSGAAPRDAAPASGEAAPTLP